MRHVTRGYTLAEMLVWFAVLFIFMSLVSWFMVSVADTSRRSHRAIEEATVRVMVLGRLGPDVRNASRILDQHAGGKSDDKTLILETPSSTHVVYRFADGILHRETTAAGRPQVVPVGRLDALTFRYDKGGPVASRWVELHMPARAGKGLTQRFHLLDPEVTP